MITYSFLTSRARTVPEPTATHLSRIDYVEWQTGIVDGVPLPPDEWFIGEIDLREVITVIEKDRLTP